MSETSPAVKKPTAISIDAMTMASQLIYASAEAMRQAASEVTGTFSAHERWLSAFLGLAKSEIDERLDRLERIMVKGGHVQNTAVVCAVCESAAMYNCPNRGPGGFDGCGTPVVITLPNPP